MTDGEGDSSERRLGHAAALLERELRKANVEAGQDANASPDETTGSLRKDADGMLEEIAINPASYREDPDRARDWFLKAAALMATDRMLTRSPGFHIETVEGTEPHLRIHVPPDRHQQECVEIRLLDVSSDTAAAMPGRVTVAGHAVAESLGPLSPAASGNRRDAPDLAEAEQAFPEMLFEHPTHLLIQQILNGNAGARMRRGLRSDVTSYRLERYASDMLKDMSLDREPYARTPFLTAGRMLRFAALLGADRMLSHPDGIGHEGLGDPDRCTRICVPPERHPPESMELTLPAVPMQ